MYTPNSQTNEIWVITFFAGQNIFHLLLYQVSNSEGLGVIRQSAELNALQWGGTKKSTNVYD
jgi:hypothetical protein